MAVTEIEVNELAEQLQAGARLIDVREPDEYTAGHVPGAVSIPLATVPDHVDAFRGPDAVYVICQGGGRSRRPLSSSPITGSTPSTWPAARGWIASGRDTVAGDQPS